MPDLEALATEKCPTCRGKKEQRRTDSYDCGEGCGYCSWPCPDCIDAAGNPTGLRYWELSKECPCIDALPIHEYLHLCNWCRDLDRFWTATDAVPHGQNCQNCSGTSRILKQGAELREGLIDALGRFGLIRHTYSVGPHGGGYGHLFELHIEGSLWKKLGHKLNETEAATEALLAVGRSR